MFIGSQVVSIGVCGFSQALGRKVDVASIDMETKLQEKGLADLFPVVAWPPHAAVQYLLHGLSCLFLGLLGCSGAGVVDENQRR